MKVLGLGRYLLEWSVLGAVLIAAGWVFGRARESEAIVPSVVAGILVVAAADLWVYILVARGLLVDPSRFMSFWGLSLLGKIVWFTLVGGVLIAWSLVLKNPFLHAMAVAFPLFTTHQVFRLVRAADRQAAQHDGSARTG